MLYGDISLICELAQETWGNLIHRNGLPGDSHNDNRFCTVTMTCNDDDSRRGGMRHERDSRGGAGGCWHNNDMEQQSCALNPVIMS